MVSSLVLMVLLGADAGPGPKSPIAVAAPGLQSVNLDAAKTIFFSDHFAQSLAATGMRVTTSAEIAALLGQERQKALLGCEESTAGCTTDLRGSLGSDALITGSIGFLQTSWQVNIKILSSANAGPLVTRSITVEGGEAALLDELAKLAVSVAPELYKALNGVPDPKLVGKIRLQASPVRKLFWLPVAAGVALVGTGVAFEFVAKSRYDALNLGSTSQVGADPAAYVAGGKTFDALGWTFIGVGAAAIVTGGIMFFAGAPRELSTQVVIAGGPQGGYIGIAGALP